MRIAIDGSHWAIPGGIRSYLENLLPALHAAAPEIDLRVLLRGGTVSAASTLPTGITPVSIPWPRRVLDRLENHLGWPRVERFAGDVDVVHGVHFSLPRAKRGVSTVLTVHDVAYLRRPDLYDDAAGNDYGYRYLLRHSLRRADRVIAISNSTRKDLIELTECDPEKVFVVPFGVDPRFDRASISEQEQVRHEIGLESDFVIYPIGTITPRKNVERTLAAFAKAFPDRSCRPTLLLTGPGRLPRQIKALIEELRLSEFVCSRSVRYPDDLRVLYSAATFGIYPSLYEGFGLPPLEAMACGLPMLVADATSCPEVVGNAALLVDPESSDALTDGMRRLGQDSSLRGELRSRGLKRVSHRGFGWDRVARQVLAVYRDDREAFAAEADPLAPPGRLVKERPHRVGS